jgi:hypothetical protein
MLDILHFPKNSYTPYMQSFINISLIGTMFISLIALLEPLTTLSFYAKLHPNATKKEYIRDGKRLGIVIWIGMLIAFF